jgi:hypothetical protein
VRLGNAKGALDRRCSTCKRRWRIEIVPATYTSERLGAVVLSIRWVPFERRGPVGRAVPASAEGQLAFEL